VSTGTLVHHASTICQTLPGTRRRRRPHRCWKVRGARGDVGGQAGQRQGPRDGIDGAPGRPRIRPDIIITWRSIQARYHLKEVS
jgi:hypothetical protein